jgi:hypothetical protein
MTTINGSITNIVGNHLGELHINFTDYNPLTDDAAIDETVDYDFGHYKDSNYISFRTEIHVLDMGLTWLANRIIITGHSDEIKYGDYLKKAILL